MRDRIPTDDMMWSVRELLDFSYIPGINEAYEGTWACSDHWPEVGDEMDQSLGLGWLGDGEGDENNNTTGS